MVDFAENVLFLEIWYDLLLMLIGNLAFSCTSKSCHDCKWHSKVEVVSNLKQRDLVQLI